jgi:poly(hydroxyalkanoate) granule-associated protein
MMEPVKATAKKAADSLNGQNPVVKIVRSVMLAAIGAVALSKEEVETIVNRLIEKGEIAEADGRELINDLIERGKKGTDEAVEKVEKVDGIQDQRIESILNRMNIPSKGDVESLSRKIGALSQKVDDLNKKIGD